MAEKLGTPKKFFFYKSSKNIQLVCGLEMKLNEVKKIQTVPTLIQKSQYGEKNASREKPVRTYPKKRQ